MDYIIHSTISFYTPIFDIDDNNNKNVRKKTVMQKDNRKKNVKKGIYKRIRHSIIYLYQTNLYVICAFDCGSCGVLNLFQ